MKSTHESVQFKHSVVRLYIAALCYSIDGGGTLTWGKGRNVASAGKKCVVLYPIHTTNRSEAKRTEAKRSEPYCRIRTIHTSTECAAMRIPQFASFHTAHSRMRFVSHWKRSEAKRTIECCYG